MDLILLQPGNFEFFGALEGLTYDNSLIGNFPWSVGENNVVTRNATAGRDPSLGQCIELLSLNQGMKQQFTTDTNSTQRSSGRPIVTEFSCSKYVDETSVKLYEYCLRAEPIGIGRTNPTKIFIFRDTNENFKNYMTIQLRDAIISEIQLQSNPDGVPTEQFKLNFTEILWTYSVPNPSIGNPAHCTTGWSILRNQAIAQFSE